MKTKITNILLTIIALLAITSCSEENVSDLQLKGNCMIELFSLDSYKGDIDLQNRSITVRVPQNYDATKLTVTALSLSKGATANVKEQDVLNMSAPQTIHVENGDVYMDWTVYVKRDEAKILSFVLNDTYTGIIDQEAQTISVFIPKTVDVKTLVPTIKYSDNATITPMSGVPTDFTNPVTYTVTNNTAKATYTVTVKQIGKPSAVYVGLAATMDQLNIEEQTACKWMLANVQNSLYASFDDIKNGTVDLSECKVIWWHFHKDGGVDGKTAFEAAAPAALGSVLKLKEYYENGGSFFFTRYATNMPAELGASQSDVVPNNCWGQNESEAEKVSSPWSFYITGHTSHALYQNLVAGSDPNQVYTCDAGYRITNSTAQWHIGTDWGGYADTQVWREKTGAVDLGYGGDGAVVVWEFPATAGKGKILCIGSGCYDWYSIDNVTENYHKNIATMTANAFNYLMN